MLCEKRPLGQRRTIYDRREYPEFRLAKHRMEQRLGRMINELAIANDRERIPRQAVTPTMAQELVATCHALR